jgi:hypothetical protein
MDALVTVPNTSAVSAFLPMHTPLMPISIAHILEMSGLAQILYPIIVIIAVLVVDVFWPITTVVQPY